MKSLVKNIQVNFDIEGNQVLILTLEDKVEIAPLSEELQKGNKLSMELGKIKKRRSLDANSYAWVLMNKIAEALGSTKEEVYKEIIKRVGQFEIIPIKNEVVDRWLENWRSKGLGWQCEVFGDSKFRGYTNVVSYFGSSVYDTKEMSVLLNEIVSECKNLGIETETEENIKSLIKEWGK